MPKKKYIILLLLLVNQKLTAQNLVPNAGFELVNACSESFVHSNLENTYNWFNIVGSSTVDWYSNCFCAIPTSIYCPANSYYGSASPYMGDAMIGFGPFSEITGIGEAVGIKLSEVLIKDSAYCFGFWVKNSRHDNAIYSLEEIDVTLLTDTSNLQSKTDVDSYISIPNTPDDGSWNYLSSYYIANGGEQFLIIGSFNPAPKYHFHPSTPADKKYTYYYFDEFSLEACNKDSLLSVVLELPNILTLNNDNINELYLIRQNNIVKLNILVLNRWGNVVKSYDGINEVWNGTDDKGEPLTEGVYFIKAIGETTFGDVIQKTQFVHMLRP